MTVTMATATAMAQSFWQVLTSCPGDPVAGIGHLAAFVVKVFNAHY